MVERSGRHPVTHGRVFMAKVLAVICGVSSFFAIAAAASTGQDAKLLDVIGRGHSTTPQNLVLASVCFVVAIATCASAIRIRHGMGRPIFEPWHGW
jgi:uncharacterized protein YggE